MKTVQRQQSTDDILQHISNEDTGTFTNEIHPKAKENKKNIFLTFFCIFLTTLVFSANSVLLKTLSYINSGQLTFTRNYGVFAGALPIAIYNEKDILGEKSSRLLLLARGIFGGLSYFADTIAFVNLPVAEATIIVCSLPAVTTVMAKIFLKEPCGLVQSFILITTICGVLLAVNVPELFNNNSEFQRDYAYFWGLAAATASVFLRSANNIIARKTKHIPFVIVMLYYGFVGMIINACIAVIISTITKLHCGWDKVLLALLLLFTFIQNMTSTVSLQRMDAGIVTVLRNLEIVLAMIFQTIFFHEIPGIYNICGGCIVILSISVLGIRNWIMTFPEESKHRRTFKYLIF